jgi:catechol 2,3-dioxygenase-like lactoylglutathione lyase family enzyme
MGGMLDHVSIQCADLAASAAFYDAVLAPLGGRRVLDFGEAIGYGVPPMPDFWLGRQSTGDGFRESHIAFTAPDRAAVHAFFEAATASGAEVLHEPRVWPEYHAGYYGAFVRDPDATTSKPSATSPSEACPTARDLRRC